MSGGFKESTDFVLNEETYGGEDIGDGMGITIWGVTQRNWPKEIAIMKGMTPEDAKEYARENVVKKYWDMVHCGSLAWPFNILMLDSAYLFGPDDAKTFLRKSTGPNTFLINRYLHIHHLIMEKPHKKKWLGGWFNRTCRLAELVL